MFTTTRNSDNSEAAELEAALRLHPGLSRVAVLVDARSGRRLYFIYALSRELLEPDVDELRDYVAAKGPAEVLASLKFVMLKSLLQVPVQSRVACPSFPSHRDNRDDIDPADSLRELEELITAICARVLKSERVDPADNFMDLGGQSLEALKVVAGIEQVLRVAIPVRSLFECPTLADVAQVVLDNESQPGKTAFIARTLMRMLAV